MEISYPKRVPNALGCREASPLKVSLAVLIRVSILEAAEVVYNRDDAAPGSAAVLLATQSAPNDLHVTHWAEHLSRDEHHVCLGRIEAGGQDTMVTKHPNLAGLEAVEEMAARHAWGATADRRCGQASQVQPRLHFFGMLHRVGEEEDGALARLPNEF